MPCICPLFRLGCLAGLLLFATGVLPARDFYVDPAGSAGSDGSRNAPWDLTTAFSHPIAVRPGDTIWLQGGLYSLNETLVSALEGAPGNPIIVRQIPDARATIDCAGVTQARLGADCVVLRGRYTWYWGFEVTNSTPIRHAAHPGATADPRGLGVQSQTGPGTKLINLVIHDVGTTLFESQPSGIEITGLIAYNTGWDGPDRPHGPGFYIRNRSHWPTKLLRENIIFQHYRQALQGYGSFDNVFSNFVLEGNIFFNNGIGAAGLHRNLMFGNANTEHLNNTFVENYTYYPPEGGQGSNLFATPEGGCRGLALHRNVFAHGPQGRAIEINNCTEVEALDNLFYGETVLNETDPSASHTGPAFEGLYPGNRYLRGEQDLPTLPLVHVRRNPYEANRAHVIIYNWAEDCSVKVEVSGLAIPPGARYEIRNAQDYYGPALSGIHRGDEIGIPMQGWRVARPIGDFDHALPESLPRFGVFVLTWRTRPWTNRQRLSYLRMNAARDPLSQSCAAPPSNPHRKYNTDRAAKVDHGEQGTGTPLSSAR